MPTTSTTTAPATKRMGGRWIDDWQPEDPTFWSETGRRVARRNLVMSVTSEHVGFSV
ncbi:MAG: hypothetical protein ACR2I1_08770 [Propionibacteriaceae bacterium]